MTTRRDALAAAAALAVAPFRAGAEADAEAAVRALYAGFARAQNDRDLERVRASLWESPDFLWVSDGRPYWGREAMIERMSGFQRAEIWRVEPDLAGARFVAVASGAAYLSVALTLVIGPAAGPSRLRFLVGALCREGRSGWRIAALFTTEDKSA